MLGSNEEQGVSKAEVEASSGSGNKSTEQVKDYIHVRARRGQATDSHSLAERVTSDFLYSFHWLLSGLTFSFFCFKLLIKPI